MHGRAAAAAAAQPPVWPAGEAAAVLHGARAPGGGGWGGGGRGGCRWSRARQRGGKQGRNRRRRGGGAPADPGSSGAPQSVHGKPAGGASWRLLRAQRHGRVSVCWLRPDTATAGSVMASQPQKRLRKSGCRREQAAEVVARAVRSTPPRPPARVPNAECMRGHLRIWLPPSPWRGPAHTGAPP